MNIEEKDCLANFNNTRGILPNAEEIFVRLKLTNFIVSEIERRALPKEQVGQLLDIEESDVAALCKADIGRFSLDRLLRMIKKLGMNVTISFLPTEGQERQTTLSLLQPDQEQPEVVSQTYPCLEEKELPIRVLRRRAANQGKRARLWKMHTSLFKASAHLAYLVHQINAFRRSMPKRDRRLIRQQLRQAGALAGPNQQEVRERTR